MKMFFVSILIFLFSINQLILAQINFFSEFIPLSSVSLDCLRQIEAVREGVYDQKEWALKMADASAKPQAGILLGNIMHVGNYDECLEIKEIVNNKEIRGKYCTAIYESHPVYGNDVKSFMSQYMGVNSKIEVDGFITNAKRSFGFCVPKICKVEDLQTIANYMENKYNSSLHFHFVDSFCDSGDGEPLSTAAIVATVIFSIFAVIIAASTLYDFIFFQGNGPVLLTTSFSLITNGKRLFSTKTSEDTMNCLNGLRVISMMWILLAHRFMNSFFLPLINYAQITLWWSSWENSFLLGASMAVDTFFSISGLLVVYLFMKSQKKGIKFSIPMFYLHRILRLTPSLAMVVLLSTTLIKYMGNGPFWYTLYEMFQKPCEKTWWSTLIYLQNYIHTHEQCVGQSWYLAVDTQMYFLSPLVLLPLIRWPRATIGVLIGIILLDCSYIFEISWKKQLGSVYFDQDATQYQYIYSPTHVRGVVYLLGMICGYLIFKIKNKKFVLSKLAVLYLWTFSLAVMLTIVIAHTHLVKNEYDVMASSFFNSLSRVSWTIALCVVIILCVTGYGGIINAFLSNKIFTVLIRLNYNVYLLHLLIMIFIVAQTRTPSYFSNMVGFHQFWGDYIFTIAASVLWTLSFESPILIIEKIIFRKPKAKEPENIQVVTESIPHTSNAPAIKNGHVK